MDSLTIFDVTVAVLGGNLLTFCFALGAHRLLNRETESWLAYGGVLGPLLLLSASYYLAS